MLYFNLPISHNVKCLYVLQITMIYLFYVFMLYCTELETAVKEAAEERRDIQEMSQRALVTAENAEMGVQNLTYKVTQFQDKTDAEIKQQAEEISSMKQQLQETTSRL